MMKNLNNGASCYHVLNAMKMLSLNRLLINRQKGLHSETKILI